MNQFQRHQDARKLSKVIRIIAALFGPLETVELSSELQEYIQGANTIVGAHTASSGPPHSLLIEGNQAEYYASFNSYIVNMIRSSRKGIPISLSALFLAVCKRLKLPGVEASAAPGHFLVRVEVFLPPFLWILPKYP